LCKRLKKSIQTLKAHNARIVSVESEWITDKVTAERDSLTSLHQKRLQAIANQVRDRIDEMDIIVSVHNKHD
jgi:hypothetical protein